FGRAPAERLASRPADLRAREHEDPGLGALATGEPRAASALHMPLPVQLGRGLPEVPDVALRVLAVPVGRPLLEPPGEIETIGDRDARHTLDPPDGVRDGHDVPRRLPVLDAAVDVGGAGPKREPRVVAASAER